MVLLIGLCVCIRTKGQITSWQYLAVRRDASPVPGRNRQQYPTVLRSTYRCFVLITRSKGTCHFCKISKPKQILAETDGVISIMQLDRYTTMHRDFEFENKTMLRYLNTWWFQLFLMLKFKIRIFRLKSILKRHEHSYKEKKKLNELMKEVSSPLCADMRGLSQMR